MWRLIRFRWRKLREDDLGEGDFARVILSRDTALDGDECCIVRGKHVAIGGFLFASVGELQVKVDAVAKPLVVGVLEAKRSGDAALGTGVAALDTIDVEDTWRGGNGLVEATALDLAGYGFPVADDASSWRWLLLVILQLPEGPVVAFAAEVWVWGKVLVGGGDDVLQFLECDDGLR